MEAHFNSASLKSENEESNGGREGRASLSSLSSLIWTLSSPSLYTSVFNQTLASISRFGDKLFLLPNHDEEGFPEVSLVENHLLLQSFTTHPPTSLSIPQIRLSVLNSSRSGFCSIYFKEDFFESLTCPVGQESIEASINIKVRERLPTLRSHRSSRAHHLNLSHAGSPIYCQELKNEQERKDLRDCFRWRRNRRFPFSSFALQAW